MYSAIFSFAYINAEAIHLLQDDAPLAIPNLYTMMTCSLMRVVLGLFWVINLYWAATDCRENLDQRPRLGVCYEMTMFLLPYAVLITFVYILRSVAD